jgi:hypothetical protein
VAFEREKPVGAEHSEIAAGTEDPLCFSQCVAFIVDVFEHFVHQHAIERGLAERKVVSVPDDEVKAGVISIKQARLPDARAIDVKASHTARTGVGKSLRIAALAAPAVQPFADGEAIFG